MATASRSLATALWGARFASGLLRLSYTTPGDTTRRWIRQHFCAECGTTLYWELEFRPGTIGVAYGAIQGKESLSPIAAVWTDHKAPWVDLPPEIPKLARQS